MTAMPHDLATDLLKLAKDEVQLDQDVAVRDADRLKVANDETTVHADERAANTAAKDVVTADKALADAIAQVHAQQQVLAAARLAGDPGEIALAASHLQGARVSQAIAQHHADDAHTAFDQAVTTLKTDTAALHADQDTLALDEAKVVQDGHVVAQDENQVNHDLGLPEGTPIDGAPPLDGHGGVITDPVFVGRPDIDDWPTTHDPHGGVIDPRPLDAGGAAPPTLAPVIDPAGASSVPGLAHDPDPALGHTPDAGDQPVFTHPGQVRDDTGHPATGGHDAVVEHDPEPVTPVEHWTEQAPSHETNSTPSHESAGSTVAEHDTPDVGHADTAALHHG